jgi:hypothetical protein
METTACSGLVDIDGTAFADAFARKSVPVRHSLADHTRISLRDIQQSPEYAELIDECVDEVDPLVAERQAGMTSRAGYLSPRPIGASEPVDRAKGAVVRSLTKLPRKLRA